MAGRTLDCRTNADKSIQRRLIKQQRTNAPCSAALLLLSSMHVLIIIIWCNVKAFPSQSQQMVSQRQMDDIVSHASRFVLVLVTCMSDLAKATCLKHVHTCLQCISMTKSALHHRCTQGLDVGTLSSVNGDSRPQMEVAPEASASSFIGPAGTACLVIRYNLYVCRLSTCWTCQPQGTNLLSTSYTAP